MKGFSSRLSWTHYRTLLVIEDPRARAFYEIEAEREGWPVPHLERQIHTQLFVRLLKSRDRDGVMEHGVDVEHGQRQRLSGRASPAAARAAVDVNRRQASVGCGVRETEFRRRDGRRRSGGGDSGRTRGAVQKSRRGR